MSSFHNDTKYEVSSLGRACGITKRKLEVLLSRNRGIFARRTDFLLLDPVSRFANWLGRGENEGYSYGWDHDVNDIAYRKLFTVMLWALPLLLAKDYMSCGVNQETFNAFLLYELTLFTAIPCWHWFLKVLYFLAGMKISIVDQKIIGVCLVGLTIITQTMGIGMIYE